MNILLHMGQGKTGTTALQRALHGSAAALAAAGVLYPAMPDAAFAHHLFLTLCEDDAHIAPHVTRYHGGLDKARAAAQVRWATLQTEIAASPPETLILSSETFIFGARAEGKHRLARLLAQLSAPVTPIIYIREPVGLYLSRLQEKMRVAVTPLPPAPQMIRAAIEQTIAAFGRMPVLVAYDPATLTGGDTPRDFFARFLPGKPDPAAVPPDHENRSLSGEATLALARYRADHLAGRDWEPDRDASRFEHRLRRIDGRLPPRKARLAADIAAAILRGSSDYLWLRDACGLKFPGLDYDRIDGTPVPETLRNAPLARILHTDPATLGRLIRRVKKAPVPR